MRLNNKAKTILGIDPGSTTVGYGVLCYGNGETKPKAIGYGYIDLKGNSDKGDKLLQLYNDLKALFKKYKPDSIAIESLYFFKNVKTFVPVMQSKGVILFSAAESKIKTYEYTPLQVKQTISGYGKASKSLIQKLIQKYLDINSTIKPDDASDALAIALCHANHLVQKDEKKLN
ncbi:MAG: crossover junction endodeoxyribonuclease RuvC [Candidatus Melainabacteria bacterium]|nr:crossover junction endodeoxyribonuclease RuvC [Candidatus Melainabacteria bacterium]